MASFRKVELEVSRGNGNGSYIVSANYRGKEISAHTNDGDVYDYLDFDFDNGIIDDVKWCKEKHEEAKRIAYRLIVDKYNQLY